MNRNRFGKKDGRIQKIAGISVWKKSFLSQVRELTAYVIVGVLTTVVYFVAYAVFKYFGINYMVNSCLSWIAAVLFAFFANKYVVFQSRGVSDLLREMIRFFGARIVTLLMDLLITWFCIELLGVGEWTTKIFSQIVVMVLNYVFSKLFVFRKGIENIE